MAKTSTPITKIQEKQSSSAREIASPSDSTINALLNFSKSLSIPTSKSIGKMIVIGN